MVHAPPAPNAQAGSEISIRFRSGSRTYTERILPVAPVRITGPSTMGQHAAFSRAITSTSGTLACYGAGMVLGAMLASGVLRAVPFGRAVGLGPFTSVLASSVMLATIIWPNGALAATSFFLFGAGPILWTITQLTLRQTVTPGPQLGQVSAIFMTVNTGIRPVGALLGGAVGEAFGTAACLWLSAAGFVVQAVIIVRSPVWRLQALPPHHE